MCGQIKMASWQRRFIRPLVGASLDDYMADKVTAKDHQEKTRLRILRLLGSYLSHKHYFTNHIASTYGTKDSWKLSNSCQTKTQRGQVDVFDGRLTSD